MVATKNVVPVCVRLSRIFDCYWTIRKCLVHLFQSPYMVTIRAINKSTIAVVQVFRVSIRDWPIQRKTVERVSKQSFLGRNEGYTSCWVMIMSNACSRRVTVPESGIVHSLLSYVRKRSSQVGCQVSGTYSRRSGIWFHLIFNSSFVSRSIAQNNHFDLY